MTTQEKIRELLSRHKPKAPEDRRAPHGGWVDHAWVVRGMVESGMGVLEAVRHVVSDQRLFPARRASSGVRAAYYAIRTKPWSERPEPVVISDEQIDEPVAAHEGVTTEEQTPSPEQESP